ncbi:MAG TPA: hypothetical protein VMS17_02585 [Gemmataceae bacterium]|nr:hypothetical protein [Gemmataceae bacterium]
MRKLIVGLALLAVIGGVAYLALFKRDAIMSLFNQGKLAAEGYQPAKTPDEALDNFRKALKERNYEAAETYLGGDYVVQFHKGAKNGADLGKAIDTLFSTMETTGTKSDKVKLVLRLLDPFPSDLKVLKVEKDGDSRAIATLTEESGAPLQITGTFQDWTVDPRMFRSLFRSMPTDGRIELKREGDADKPQWKLYLPVDSNLRQCVDYLADNGSNYVNGINRVKEDLKNDATTKESLENSLKTALKESK